jgi:hypothetical protein
MNSTRFLLVHQKMPEHRDGLIEELWKWNDQQGVMDSSRSYGPIIYACCLDELCVVTDELLAEFVI